MNNCLYKSLLSKPYPEHQYMDKESVEWLGEHLNINLSLSDIQKIFIKLKKFPIDSLDFSIEVYKKNNCYGIHGIRHQLRVSLYIWILIQYYNIELKENDSIDLLQAALYHDLLRKNDNLDQEHGKNSALWIKKKYKYISDSIIKAVANHDRSLDKWNIYDALIKTADALDRYRLPKEKWWINKEFLLIKIDDKLLDICKFITFYTEKRTYNIMEIEKIIEELILCLKEMNIV